MIDVRPACGCFFLSHRLVQACEIECDIELSHMYKNNAAPDLVCRNKCYETSMNSRGPFSQFYRKIAIFLSISCVLSALI